MAYGVTDDGFVVKPLADIKADLEAAFKAQFGNSVNLSAQSNNGQLIGIVSERLSELWDLAQAVYASQYPDSATADDSLDNVCAITGTVRAPPRKSTVTLTLTGTPATIVPAGTEFSVTATEAKFVSTEEATIGGGGTVDVVCESEEYGAIVAASGTLTVIDTPVSGLTSVSNALDALPGQTEESNAALRLRRETELRAQGNATVEAIRADVLGVSGVTACSVFENTTSTTDADGVPAKAIEVVVLTPTIASATDDLIREAIWESKPAGIETHGGVSGTVTDSGGMSRTVEFSRPTDVDVYITVDVTTDSDWPADGSDQVKAALTSWALGTLVDASGVPLFAGYDVGADVVQSQLFRAVYTVSGITDVTAIKLGVAASPTLETNLTIDSRELARFDTSRIVVNVT